MKKEKTVSYAKPELTPYRFFGVVKGEPLEAGKSGGGDIDEECDSGFDD